MPEIQQTKTETQNATGEETITIVVYEETTTTYQVPAQHLRDLGLPVTPEELSAELVRMDVDEAQIMDAVDGIEAFDYAVQERQISFRINA